MSGSGRDQAELRQELLDYHQAFVDAHIDNRPAFMVQDLAEDYINVSRGDLLRQTKEEILEMFTAYLGSTTFTEYRVMEEPTLGFSKDRSVAWSIFRLKVAGTRVVEDGEDVTFDTIWGCLVLFERRGDRWVRIAEASNHKPG